MCTIYTPTPKCRNLLSSILYSDIGTHSDPHVTGLNKSFTEEECQRFKKRWENGYDLKHDERYNSWVRIHHPNFHTPSEEASTTPSGTRSPSVDKASLPSAVSSLLVVPKAPECRRGVSKQGTKPRITAQDHSEDETDTGEPGESLKVLKLNVQPSCLVSVLPVFSLRN